MQQLPKAERLFSQIINKKIEGYIKQSEGVSNEYLRQHSQAQKNKQLSFKAAQDLRYQVAVLNNIILSGVELQGTQLEQIKKIRDQYLEVLNSYQKQRKIQAQIDQNFQEVNKKRYINQQFSQKLSEIDSSSNLDQYNIEENEQRNLIKKNYEQRQWLIPLKLSFLKGLEILAFSLMIVAVFYTIIK